MFLLQMKEERKEIATRMENKSRGIYSQSCLQEANLVPPDRNTTTPEAYTKPECKENAVNATPHYNLSKMRIKEGKII